MATHIDSAKSAKSYLPHIPVEVYEHIVASGPSANTLTCALVCRTLYHRSRYLSLETVYLRDTPHVFQLSKYIRKHAQYRRVVKTVHIVGGEGGTARHLGTFAATCAPLLPAAGTLVIRGVKWGAGQTHQKIFQHLAILQGVVALTLKDIELPSPASLASLLRAFPALASLSCEQVRVHQYAKGRSALSTKTAELGLPWTSWCTQFALYADDVSAKPLSIAIGHGRWGFFDTVLFSTIDVDVTLKCLATSDLGSLFSSLHGPRLLSFRLNIDCRGLPSHLATNAVGKNLSLASLEVMALSLHIHIDAHEARDFDFGWLVDMLESIDYENVWVIKLSFQFSGGDDMDGVQVTESLLDGDTTDVNLWRLDQLLSDEPFTSLREVWMVHDLRLCPKHSEGHMLFERTLLRQLPSLRQRPNLVVH